VAAKKIKMDNEKEGFPITAIREVGAPLQQRRALRSRPVAAGLGCLAAAKAAASLGL
jgi:hypothetical protein